MIRTLTEKCLYNLGYKLLPLEKYQKLSYRNHLLEGLTARFLHDSTNYLHKLRMDMDQLRSEERNSFNQKYLSRLEEDVSAITAMFSSFHSLYSETSKGEASQKKYYNLNAVIEEACLTITQQDSFRPKIERSYSSGCDILCSGVQIRQAIRNILENAIEACNDKCHIRINTSKVIDDKGIKHVRIKISNNGLPIHKGNAEYIFDAGFTTKPNGTGLGLAIAKHHVEQNGGVISFESNAMSETQTNTMFVLDFKTSVKKI